MGWADCPRMPRSYVSLGLGYSVNRFVRFARTLPFLALRPRLSSPSSILTFIRKHQYHHHYRQQSTVNSQPRLRIPILIPYA